jgi:hypothetical protein
MPRYFLHLIDGTNMLLDPDGVLMPPEMVERVALRAARDCIAGDVHHGRLDLGLRIEVLSQSGEVVHRLKFSDAVEVVSSEFV